jgi:2-keto-4-pentenoate hydratase/2-oxohepta-3-ene-1,7-dioic acid hydratase in catechol pathway
MRFATFSREGAPEVGAVWEAEGLIRPLHERPLAFTGDMSDLIERYEELKLSEVRLLAPILTPRRNVFCVGKNYKEHAKEFSQSGFDSSSAELSEVPIIFTKSPSSVVGPGADICSHPGLTESLDYEAESRRGDRTWRPRYQA